MREEDLKELEGLFVREFRASQALHDLTKDERLALSSGDVPRLLAVTGRKESILDDLGGLVESRRTLLRNLMNGSDRSSSSKGAPALSEILAKLDMQDASRLLHLQDGILVMMDKVRELTQMNRALASYSLQHASALQTRLTDLYRGAKTHKEEVAQPTAGDNQPAADLPALFAAIIEARDALNEGEGESVSAAIAALGEALDHLNQFLEKDMPRQQRMKDIAEHMQQAQLPAEDLLKPQETDNLVEVMARLYRQETAYQAVLKVSNRTLASV